MFYSIGVPLVFVGLSVAAKRLGRQDWDAGPMINLFAVSTSTVLMSLATAISDLGRVFAGAYSSTASSEYILFWIVIFLALLLVSIDFDRYGSWDRDAEGKPTGKKRLGKGVLGPNAVVVVAFVAYRLTA
jgi:hypothetical protein